jgi:hypothetical protein
MWYELIERVNYHTTRTHIVWLASLDHIFVVMDHLNINACNTHKLTDEGETHT